MDRDIYQIVLQLKDELTAGLKQVNTTLQGTQKTAATVKTGVTGIATSMKSAMAQIQQFARAIGMAMNLGGAAFLINRIANELGKMQVAFEKANPEAAKAAGSLTQWNAAMTVMAEKGGGGGKIVADILNPIREAFLNFIDPTLMATANLKLFNAEMQTLIDKYADPVKKALMAQEEATIKLEKAEADLINTKKERLRLEKELQAARGWVAPPLEFNMMGEITGGGGFGPDINAITKNLLTAIDAQLKAEEAIKTLQKWIKDNPWQKTLQVPVAAKELPIEDRESGLDQAIVDRAKLMRFIQIATAEMGAEDRAGRWEQVWSGQLHEAKTQSDVLRKFRDTSKKQNDKQLEATKELLKIQVQQAMGFFQNPADEIGKTLTESATAAMAIPGANIGSMLTAMVSGVGELAKALVVMGPMVVLFLALMEIFEGMVQILGPVLFAVFEPFVEFLMFVGNAIGTLLMPIFQAFEPALGAIVSLLMICMPLFQLLAPIFQALGMVIKIVLLPVVAVIYVVITVINLIIDGINAVLGWAGVNLSRLALPTMPTFHEGGKADEDMVAILKKGEVVMNPYRSASYIAGGGATGGITINAPNARYLDANTAGELVKLGLAAMRA